MNTQRQLNILLLIVFVGFIGTSVPYPIFAPLFLHPEHGTIVPDYLSDNTRNLLLGLTLAVYPFGQFLGAPILGALSDQYGRKYLLLATLVIATLGNFLCAIAIYQHILWLLIISRFITGCAEANIAIARAMATDLKNISKYKSFGRINAAAAIGYIVGPLIGGFLSDHLLVSWFNFSTPFYVAGATTFIAGTLTLFFLRESLSGPSEKIMSLRQQFNMIKRFKRFSEHRTLCAALLISSLFTLSVDLYYEFFTVYFAGAWQLLPRQIALYNLILCLGLTLSSAYIVPWLSQKNKTIIITSSMLYFSVFVTLFILSNNRLFVFILFGCIGLAIAISSNLLSIKVSDLAPEAIRGEVLGSIFGLRALGDACICLIAGVMIIGSLRLPLIASAMLALISALVYMTKMRRLQS